MAQSGLIEVLVMVTNQQKWRKYRFKRARKMSMQTCSKWENPINGNNDVSSFTKKNPPKEQNCEIYDVTF